MPSQSQVPHVVISGLVRWPGPALATFRQKHPNWLETFEGAGPVYALLPMASEALLKPPPGRQPILTGSQVETELAFFDMCRAFDAVALWNGRFIGTTYLVRPPAPSEADQLGLNWSPEQIKTAEMLVGKTDSISGRLKGYMGWLVTDPEFLLARDELAAQWHALPETSRPYPIVRSLAVPKGPPESGLASEPVAAFQQMLNAFLDRWGLTRMLTWDLPEPQGPMLPSPIPADSPAMPKHGLHFVLPTHYPLTGTDDLLHQIQKQQANLAQEHGLDATLAGLPHFEAYGQMLEVDLLERTILSRYGKPKRPRGLVTVMERSIAEALGLSAHQVQKLRKGIVACRKGKRSTVKWLKTTK